MAVTGVQPVAQVTQANTETVLYTAPPTQLLQVATATLTNTSASAVTVNLSVVSNGHAAGTSNRVISGYSLAAGDTLSLTDYLEGAILGPGDFVSANNSATGVTLVMTGTYQTV